MLVGAGNAQVPAVPGRSSLRMPDVRFPSPKRVAISVSWLLLAVTGPLTAQERVVIGGAGAHVPVMLALAEAYQARHPSQHIEVIGKPLGSTGGIRAVQAGVATIGLTSRPLHADEQRGLVYRAYGRTPLVVGMHPDVPVDSLTDAQFCDIFAGRTTSWKDVGGPDARIVILTRNEDGTKETFREQVACFRHLKETPEAIAMTKPTAMSDALSRRPWTIGLTDLAALINAEWRFKALAISGVVPSVEALRNGQYPLSKTFGVVTAGEPRGSARQFLEFVVGPEGERVMSRHGLAVVP